MKQNLQIITKKFWNVVRVTIFLLRKGVSKSKLLKDLNMMMKRGKNAGGNAMHNLMHHRRGASSSSSSSASSGIRDHLPFHIKKRKNTPTLKHEEDAFVVADVVTKAIEMLKDESALQSSPGFGKSPLVRQLRVTDSPFPLNNNVEVDDNHVDEAAEKFIDRFYKNLMKQTSIDWGTPGR